VPQDIKATPDRAIEHQRCRNTATHLEAIMQDRLQAKVVIRVHMADVNNLEVIVEILHSRHSKLSP
jgi:hypothetical protein